MNRNTAIGVISLLILILFPILLGYTWYVGYWGNWPPSEKTRIALDKRFSEAYYDNNPRIRWIYNYIFRNKDKPVWRPTRLLPSFDKSYRKVIAYQLHGVVADWNEFARILTLDTYIGRRVFVRVDSARDGSMVIIPELDAWGAVGDVGAFPTVNTPEVGRSPTLFCRGDNVLILMPSKLFLVVNTRSTPLIPISVAVTQRLCKL